MNMLLSQRPRPTSAVDENALDLKRVEIVLAAFSESTNFCPHINSAKREKKKVRRTELEAPSGNAL